MLYGFNDRNDDYGFSDFLQQIIDMNHLDDPSLGITKQVITKGEDSLSDKQKQIFEKHVLDFYTISECSRCGGDIPWVEMYDVATDHNMCNWCWHQSEKED